jgi:hypothetical protein
MSSRAGSPDGRAEHDETRVAGSRRHWLRDDEAAVIARALRDRPDAARHFAEVADNRHADERIRRAVRPAPSASPSAR